MIMKVVRFRNTAENTEVNDRKPDIWTKTRDAWGREARGRDGRVQGTPLEV
jgi:hypothetical protein